MTRHISERKQASLLAVQQKLDAWPIIGVLNMESLPAGNLAAMRKQLRGQCEILMAKKRIIRLALDGSKKPHLKELSAHLKGVPALLFTKENPFSLFKTLKKNQSKAPMKPGQKAPYDIIIPAGPTSFPPGPIIGELGQLGIKAGIQDGKVVVKQDCTLLHEGDTANDKQAGLLARMAIMPMRIGLTLTAVYENGEILNAKVLDIDEDKFVADLRRAAGDARGLALGIAWPAKDIIETLIQKGHYEAAGLALEANLITDENSRQLLAKAYWQAIGVVKYLPEDMRSELPAAEAAPAAPAAKEVKDEKKSESEAAAGLGSLFG